MVRCNFCNQECKNEQKFIGPKSLQILLENAERVKSVGESEIIKLRSENNHLKLLINNNITTDVCNLCSNMFFSGI